LAIATLRGTAVGTVEAELREAGIAPADHAIPWATPAELPDMHVDLAALDEDLNTLDDGRSTSIRVARVIPQSG
jgi:hypothetical protein